MCVLSSTYDCIIQEETIKTSHKPKVTKHSEFRFRTSCLLFIIFKGGEEVKGT